MRLYGEWNYSGPVEPLSMRLILPLCGLLIAAVCVRGDEPAFAVVVGEAPPQLHPVELKPLAPIVVPAGASFGWSVEPEPEEWVESTPLVCKFRGKARVYEVQAVLFANGRFTRVPKLAPQKVVVGAPKPDPGPGPQPPPDPLPPTDEVAAVVLLVADPGASSPLTPEQRLFLLDESPERRKLSELGIKNYQVSPGSDADAKGYSKFLADQKVPPPAVIAIYKNGSKRAIKLPPNGTEFLKSVGVKP